MFIVYEVWRDSVDGGDFLSYFFVYLFPLHPWRGKCGASQGDL